MALTLAGRVRGQKDQRSTVVESTPLCSGPSCGPSATVESQCVSPCCTRLRYSNARERCPTRFSTVDHEGAPPAVGIAALHAPDEGAPPVRPRHVPETSGLRI
eukprot:scaffold82022_cov30-Phaeocystis_antarctica.AAC.1